MVKRGRLSLSDKFHAIEGLSGVYFQPPKSIKMQYPCVIYHGEGMSAKYADNHIYIGRRKYTVTIVDKNPDSELPNKLLGAFSMISFDRSYTADNLNHFVFTLYY